MSNLKEFPALLDHVREAVGGCQVFVQVPLVGFAQRVLPAHHSAAHTHTPAHYNLDNRYPFLAHIPCVYMSNAHLGEEASRRAVFR